MDGFTGRNRHEKQDPSRDPVRSLRCNSPRRRRTSRDVQKVSFPSGSDTASGYLALPAGFGRHPAVVVIQEWWGVNDWLKEQAQRVADEGYVALAVDLYRGKVATDAEMAHELARGLPQDRGVRDLPLLHG